MTDKTNERVPQVGEVWTLKRGEVNAGKPVLVLAVFEFGEAAHVMYGRPGGAAPFRLFLPDFCNLYDPPKPPLPDVPAEMWGNLYFADRAPVVVHDTRESADHSASRGRLAAVRYVLAEVEDLR